MSNRISNLLVLEDEPFIAMDLKFACEDAGYEAVTAVDNDEALDCITKRNISGAILDVSLGGGATCKPTAHALNERGIPFLLHTGDLNRAGEHLREFDAPVLPKPMNADEVVARLLNLIQDGEQANASA